MQQTDQIAILLASCNGEKYIAEQIESLLKQTEAGWELFIHDDGSTDRTPEILRRCEVRHPERIHVLDGPPCGGAKDNFLRMMRDVRAPYVMFCDQDDVWLPEKVELTLREMKRLEAKHGAEKPLLVFTDLCVTDERLHPIAAPERLSEARPAAHKSEGAHDPERDHRQHRHDQPRAGRTGCKTGKHRRDHHARLVVRADCGLLRRGFLRGSGACPVPSARRQRRGRKNLTSLRYLTAQVRRPTDIKNSLLATQRQAALFAETFPPADAIFREYGELGGKRKSERLWFYAKNGIWKCGWQRNLGLLVWG